MTKHKPCQLIDLQQLGVFQTALMLVLLACLAGYLLYREWTAEGPEVVLVPVADPVPVPPASPASAPIALPPAPVSTPVALPDGYQAKIKDLGADFSVQVAVGRMADEWERQRSGKWDVHQHSRRERDRPDVAPARRRMQVLGRDQFAVVIRKMHEEKYQMYSDAALRDVVRAALQHKRAQASPAQREVLLQGIFAAMYEGGGAAQ